MRRTATARRGLGAELIGIDLRREAWPRCARPSSRTLAPILIGLLLGGFLLTGLRVDLIRVRYALAEAVERERVLLEEQRALTVEMRRLRQPSQLTERARERGFVPPQRVIRLSASPRRPRPRRVPSPAAPPASSGEAPPSADARP